jgi:hypothetical protein
MTRLAITANPDFTHSEQIFMWPSPEVQSEKDPKTAILIRVGLILLILWLM